MIKKTKQIHVIAFVIIAIIMLSMGLCGATFASASEINNDEYLNDIGKHYDFMKDIVL